MAIYYPDSSALCKRYVAEVGSAWLRALLAPTTGCTVVIGRMTTVEIIAALSRRERAGSLTSADATLARADFRSDLSHEYQVVEITETIADYAMQLAETHKLRGYDAVQLAAALSVNTQLLAAAQSPLILISADAELNAAASDEGLHVEDPNTHP